MTNSVVDATTIIPFDPPILWIANPKAGFVNIPDSSKEDGAYCRGWDTTLRVMTNGTTTTNDAAHSSSSMTPPSLQRRQTMSGNIIVVTPAPPPPSSGSPSTPKPTLAYWLHRKIGQHKYGIVRLGYKLKSSADVAGSAMMNSSDDDDEDHDTEVAGGGSGAGLSGRSTRSSSLSNFWELETDDLGRPTLVAVTIIHSSSLSSSSNDEVKEDMDDEASSSSSSPPVFLPTDRSPLDEMSALQMIDRYYNSMTDETISTETPTTMALSSSSSSSSSHHVLGANMVTATCSQGTIYTIVKYHRDGTLLQFCQTNGCLEESLARFLFRQIVQGLYTLQQTGLCHRNLSLDAIGMDGDHLDICDLGWAVRLKKNSNSNNKNNNTSTRSSRSITRTITSDQSQPVDDNNNDKKEWNNVHPVPPPPPGGSDPRFITPEYIMTTSGGNGSGNDVNDANCNNQNNEQTEVMKWNGYQADLWAAGLMLFSMIVGAESLFVAPIYEDKTFARLCVKGDIRGHIKKYGRVAGRTDDLSATLSEDLVDLLRSMLRANPLKRLSLDDVMAHPWVTTDEVVTPSEWICKNRHPSTTDVYNSSVAESEMIS